MDIKERFLSKIKKSDNGCWEWIGASRGKCGYGSFSVNSKVFSSHRISYELFVEEIPKGLLVCHKCDNKLCVNPDHLFLGTQSDNMKDAYKKGRLFIPTFFMFKNGKINNKSARRGATTTNKIARKIKKELKRKELTQEQIGKLYNLPRHIIADINIGRSYKYA